MVAVNVIICSTGKLGVAGRNLTGSDTDTSLSAVRMSVSHGIITIK